MAKNKLDLTNHSNISFGLYPIIAVYCVSKKEWVRWNLSGKLIFAKPAGGHKCIKEHHECPNKSENQRHPAEVLNSHTYLYPHSEQHLQNCVINSKDFLTRTAQGRRHIKSKKKKKGKYGGHIFRYGHWFLHTRSFWDTQYKLVVPNHSKVSADFTHA